MPTATLLLAAPDKPGLVAAVAGFLVDQDANIVHADQHVDPSAGVFVQRVEFDLDGIDTDQLTRDFAPIAESHGMEWGLHRSDAAPRVAILASKQPHCLVDLLGRWGGGEMPGSPELVISNHADHEGIVGHYDLPYHHLPITPETKDEQEQAMLGLLEEASIDLVILARYMQILSPRVVDAYSGRIINIHHSFLPAFAGGRPYHQAHDRGVKVIGATAHYVTVDLDEGPIIDQDVTRVSHRDAVQHLVAKGRDLEKVVLARAVRYHLEHRVLIVGGKTVVFD